MTLLPGKERDLALSPYTAPLQNLDRNQQLSRRLRALATIRRKRASLEMLHWVRR